ncbi:MAG: hypothetical protein NTW67_04190 [Candidatus Woesearchaeota archaeon]|nr:hypothetical protein [Candidatus Woesearchaeota archaeon]
MRKLIMILCLAVMAMFLVSCAGKASLMPTNDCDKRCANRINPMEANYRNQISGLQGANRALETQAKLAGDSTKTIAKLTKENTQYQADISRLKEQLEIANQKIALTQTTGTTPATCPAMTSIVTAPVTAAPQQTIKSSFDFLKLNSFLEAETAPSSEPGVPGNTFVSVTPKAPMPDTGSQTISIILMKWTVVNGQLVGTPYWST